MICGSALLVMSSYSSNLAHWAPSASKLSFCSSRSHPCNFGLRQLQMSWDWDENGYNAGAGGDDGA